MTEHEGVSRRDMLAAAAAASLIAFNAPAAEAAAEGPTDGAVDKGRPLLIRAGKPLEESSKILFPLSELRGDWVGKGFNLISLPDKQGGKPFRLKLNKTRETLTFKSIGKIPNRGSAQLDLFLGGLSYLQHITDDVTDEVLHVEPGLWLTVPEPEAPTEPRSVIRHASIPHGNSLLAEGKPSKDDGGPQIGDVDSTPIKDDVRMADKKYLAPFFNTPLPPGLPDGSIHNPNLVLKEAIKGQDIVHTVALHISTQPKGMIGNIPFLLENAKVTRLDAVFWIEKIKQADDSHYMQLQYTQTVILNFIGIDWPHISVATLVKF